MLRHVVGFIEPELPAGLALIEMKDGWNNTAKGQDAFPTQGLIREATLL